jgi:hypothetical protein
MQNILYNTFPVPHNVFEEEKFISCKTSTKLFYIGLLKLHNRYADLEGWFWRSNRLMSIDMNLTEKTIRSAKKELLKNDYIEVKNGAYDPKSNTRGACLFRVNGFQKPAYSKQEKPQEDASRIITVYALEEKFRKGREVFNWLIENDFYKRLSHEEIRLKAPDTRVISAIGKEYGDIFDGLIEFLKLKFGKDYVG